MWILTDKLVFVEPYTYYDIVAAGPTLLKHLTGLDLLSLPKTTRNINYGKLLVKLGLQDYIPFLLRSYCKYLCYQVNGILYTQDSVVTLHNPQEVLPTIFTFRKEWTSSLLVIAHNRKSYICWTTEGQVIVKGDELPVGCLNKLYTFIVRSSNWLYEYKMWFLEARAEEFVTNKRRLILKDKVVDEVSVPSLFEGLVDKEVYWRKLLPYFASMYEFLREG